MNIYALIPLLAATGFLVVIGVVLTRPLTRVHRVFLAYLAVSMLWSVSSFLLHVEFFPQLTFRINQALLIMGATVPIIYFHFVRAFFNRSTNICVVAGYLILAGFAIFVSLGGMLKSSYVLDGILYHEFDAFLYLLVAFEAVYQGTAIFYLVQGFRGATNPQERNRVGYLLLAVTVWMLFMFTNFIPVVANYSVDHIGNIANIGIISYAIMRFQLLNITYVARKSLSYLIMTLGLAGVYATIVLIGLQFFPLLPLYSTFLIASGATVLVALLTPSLRLKVQEAVDRLFYGRTYEHRRAVLNFGTRMGNIINLGELASEMLPAITRALRATRAMLLLQDGQPGDFTAQFVYPESAAEDRLKMGADNPVVTKLDKDNSPIDMRQLDSIPEFKGLWQSEKQQLIESNLGLLCPIKSRGSLIGILALGKKQTRGIYTAEDLDLAMSIASQAGVVIENAQLYSQALVRANTDGLTGLYNHRYFHERLEQEIARSSRFGHIFTVIMLDIDLFKTYNDNHGHLAGDDVLRRIGDYVKSSIRTIDVASRYGGEEFAIVLPQTRLEDAHVVAERIRKTVESRTISRGMPVTVSLGVASWPLDGVMKEEIIARADAALYRAKQSGRNRTCLSTEVTGNEEKSTPATGAEAGPRTLSTVYALAATVDAKDHYTYGHSKKVSEYAVALADAIGLPLDKVATIRAAALLHDIGKIGIPDSILNKKGPLTDEEWEVVKEHPRLGVEILRHVIDLVHCLPAVMHHHEHFDAKGYPAGFMGDSIPIEARILAIADAYDAMTSQRPYREQLSPQKAMEELKQCAGTQFDIQLVEVFRKVIETILAAQGKKVK
ncbi:MAG: diguanylate cyclase [Chloroflexi bacterium]|nr:diguanylate cyclase [Chloroflexota bacterium]